MTAVQDLLAKHKDPSAYFNARPSEFAEAIFELDQRLEMLEAQQPAATESPPEPFRITVPGKYRTEVGGYVWICCIYDYAFDRNSSDGGSSWLLNGTLHKVASDTVGLSNIVSGPFTDAPQQKPETAGLVGKYAMSGIRLVPLDNDDEARRILEQGGKVFDLSYLPSSAIVTLEPKCEPKREMRNVRLGIWPDGRVDVIRSDLDSHKNMVAIIDREIDYAAGEGLESGQ